MVQLPRNCEFHLVSLSIAVVYPTITDETIQKSITSWVPMKNGTPLLMVYPHGWVVTGCLVDTICVDKPQQHPCIQLGSCVCGCILAVHVPLVELGDQPRREQPGIEPKFNHQSLGLSMAVPASHPSVHRPHPVAFLLTSLYILS